MDDLTVKYGSREWALVMRMRGYEVRHQSDSKHTRGHRVAEIVAMPSICDDGWSSGPSCRRRRCDGDA